MQPGTRISFGINKVLSYLILTTTTTTTIIIIIIIIIIITTTIINANYATKEGH